jgi:hypothetical protein
MADLLGNDTDLEDNKYYEAQLAFEAGIDPAIEKNKKSAFNADTGKHEILMPMPEGGYIKIGEEGGKVDPPPSVLVEGMEFGPETPEFQRYYPAPQVMDEAPMQPETPGMEVDPMQVAGAQRYAEDLRAQTGSYSMEDLEAAGYGADVAEAAGLVSPVEPMSQEEIAKIVSEGGSLIGPYDPTIREDGVAILREFSIEASEQELREELAAAGADPRTIELEVQAAMPSIRSEADILSNAVFGTGNPLGIGAADFVTLGVMDIQEGSRMFQQNRGPNGSVAGRAIGTLLVLAGVAEATGVGMVAGKLLKKAAMKLQGPMVRAGEQAQQRIAQEGSTLFSNPVGPAVDRGLAAAGRLVAPKLDTLNDFVSLASKGQLRQARTTEQDINDIMQKKMPATKITMQGASEDLSTAYETGEITDQLEQAGLFFEDDMMGTIFVGTTQDNLNAIKTAKTPAEIGKLSGYSDADIAAFYLKRRGGDKESAFSEYSSDLNIEEGGRLVAPKQSEVDAAKMAYEADPNNVDLKNEYFSLRKQRDENPVESFEPPTEEDSGLIVFHGSGADFDEFKLDKINTGEGAQAYGYGLYFTDSEDIANFYKSSVRQVQDLRQGYEVSYKGKAFKNLGDTSDGDSAGLEYFAVSGIMDNLPKVITMETKDLPQSELIQLAKDMRVNDFKRQIERLEDDEVSDLILQSLNQELSALEAIDPNDIVFSEGKTYQVNVGVKPDELLDFDKPFEEQSPLVQRAVAKTFYEMTEDDAANFGFETVSEAQPYLLDGFTAQRFLNDWSSVRGSDDAGEKLLEKHGVKGIKYKANRGASDAPKEGPSNYVIFDDKLIQIMKKYGIVGPVSVTALTSKGENTEGAGNGI